MSGEEGGQQEAVQDEVDEEKPVKVYKATCVSGGGLGNAVWLPETAFVGGQEYIKLAKWDRDLTKLCTNKAMNLYTSGKKPLNNINCEFFPNMASLRCTACNQALKKVMEQAAQAEGVPLPGKLRPATAQDKFVAGQTVVVEAPAILDDEGNQVMEETSIRMLWGVRGHDLWVEATEEVINYVIEGVKHSKPYEQPASKRGRHKGASPKKKKRRGRPPARPAVDDTSEEALPLRED